MSPDDLDRLLEAAIPAAARTSVTLTETPADPGDVLRLLERAMTVGYRRGAPLVEIEACLADYPDLPGAFWHVPIEDCAPSGVLRLVFAPTLSSAA